MASPFSAAVLQGTPLAHRCEVLCAAVAAQCDASGQIIVFTQEIHELLTIVQKLVRLSDNPFRGATLISQPGEPDMFMSFLGRALFFHVVEGRQVWLVGAIFGGDAPDSPEGASSGPGITTLAGIILKGRGGAGPDRTTTGHVASVPAAGLAPHEGVCAAWPGLAVINGAAFAETVAAIIAARNAGGNDTQAAASRPGFADADVPVARQQQQCAPRHRDEPRNHAGVNEAACFGPAVLA
jgi:hypothetical protein